jgi:hypothetical protein
MTQPAFIFARDTHLTDPAELQRLSGQCARILARLEHGPATGAELMQIAPRFGARLFDLREHLKPQGRTVKVIERDHKTGYVLYALYEMEQRDE